MTGPDDGTLMGRADLESAFTALGARLARRGVIADIFVVGGAAMALAYDANRVTRDVDAVFVPHGVVLDESRAVAEELGLPPWWLNEQASVYVSGKDDPGRRRVFDHPNLRVSVASPEHIFAMKALAARTRDLDDLRRLAELVGVHTVDDALRICQDFYPDEEASPRARRILAELFEHRPAG
jgi:predicted nucleotidyltransferase